MPLSARKLFDCAVLEPAALHKILASSFQRGKCGVQYAKSSVRFDVAPCVCVMVRSYSLFLCFNPLQRGIRRLDGASMAVATIETRFVSKIFGRNPYRPSPLDDINHAQPAASVIRVANGRIPSGDSGISATNTYTTDTLHRAECTAMLDNAIRSARIDLIRN